MRSGSVLAVVLVVVATLAGVAALGVWFVWERCGLRGCPEVSVLRGYIPDEATTVVDRNGEELARLYLVRRVLVELDSLPDHVPAAFIAVEDRRYLEHNGIDWSRAFGAAWHNLRAREVEEGFSTIPMQLARNVFPEELPARERTVARKLAEMHVARRIEQHYGKREILALYLNQIYFGNGAWGIETASWEYLGKSASDLTLAEAALLAGIPPAPTRLNPRANADRALARRNMVLRRMARDGWITQAEAYEAMSQPLELDRKDVRWQQPDAPYFVEDVRQIAERRFGLRLYTEGLTIHTTLDARAQAAAEAELEQHLQAIETGRHGAFRHPSRAATAGDGGEAHQAPYLQGAVVVLDPNTGDILAMVGGRDFQDSRYNRARQARRQPGSAFKPFVYAAALAQGISLAMYLEDSPMTRVVAGRIWAPRNYGGSYSGWITVRDALVHSKNVATVRLAEQAGLNRVIQTALGLGISEPIPRVPSVAIGAGEVTLLDLTAAYGAFATLGRLVSPRWITRVEDRSGRVVWEPAVANRQALEPAVAFLLTDILQDVVNRGTGHPARQAGFRAPAAGKTGTTNDETDVWFIGYTPDRVTGVWIGFDRPRTIFRGATGGRLAAPVWGRVMSRIGAGGVGWGRPAGVERRLVDAAGNVEGSGCPMRGELREEYHLTGAPTPDRCYDFPGDTLSEEAWRRLLGREWHDPTRRDTLRRDTLPGRDTLDARRDTTLADTLRAPPDTGDLLGRPVRPGTGRPPPDTARRPLPDTGRLLGRPLRDTPSRPPPDTTRR